MCAYMRFPEMTPRIKKIARKYRNSLLRELGLKEGGTKLKILKELSKVGKANIYELWKKRLPDIGHYSTVLRALKSLEQKNLVTAHTEEGGRTKRIHATTYLGNFVVVLAEGGWRSLAQTFAKESPSFRQSILAHFSRNPYRYWSLTRDIIEEYVRIAKACVGIYITPYTKVEGIVKRLEIEWIKSDILDQINDPSSRPWISKYLKRMSHFDWIASELSAFLDDYITDEREWLRTLEEFRKDLLSSEKSLKLTKFSVE
jgi:Fe2+ or Zn2+ uptake regulation protein